tara:strand:- start:43 stop:834 length:792 start_codon:yes stop_codon:yes gene_type:complete
MKTILSLGAGVQSSTIALMAAHGEVGPMPDCAIFADTQAEPQTTYDYLDRLIPLLPYPVHRVTAGDLREAVINPHRGFMPVPFRLKREDGTEGLTRRQCTREYKITPVTKKVRSLIGMTGKKIKKGLPLVEMWMGISLDEIQRMKENRDHWITNRFPLIEERMTRGHCMEWLQSKGYEVPPKSACTFCPYHGNEQWRYLRDNDADAWQDAVDVDAAIRGNTRNATGEMFVHRDLIPLPQADLSTAEDHGQLSFLDECEGMCGV